MNESSGGQLHAALEKFVLAEYSALRKEIDAIDKEFRDVERYAVAAAVAVWTWLGKQESPITWAWGIPLVIAAAGYLRHKAILEHSNRMGTYIREHIETQFGEGIGWEHFFVKDRYGDRSTTHGDDRGTTHGDRREKWLGLSLDRWSDLAVWIVLAVASVVAPIFAYFLRGASPTGGLARLLSSGF